MSKVIAITVSHCEPRILEHGLAVFYGTCGITRPDRHVIVQNHWPIDHDATVERVRKIAAHYRCELIDPHKNIGGHGGVNFALKHVEPNPEDLILIYDPDSNPIGSGWLRAMIDVMESSSLLAYVALQHSGIPKDWKSVINVAGHMVGIKPYPDMINVSLWWADFLRNGLEAEFEFYGQVERPMFRKARSIGMTMGYMLGYFESPCPIPVPKIYIDWKLDHVSNRFTGNFDEYVKLKGVT